MSATKNDKRQANLGLQNIRTTFGCFDNKQRFDARHRFSTVHLCQKELHQRCHVSPRSAASVRNNEGKTYIMHIQEDAQTKLNVN